MASISITEMINRFESLVSELEAAWPDIITENAQDAIALIEERITTLGQGADGSALRPYTKPYQKFKESPHNYKRGAVLGLASSRFTGKTDYTLTGMFWKDIQIINVSTSGSEVTVTAGPTKQVNKDIMESLTKRDGFPLTLAEAEKEILVDNTGEKITRIIDKYFPQ